MATDTCSDMLGCFCVTIRNIMAGLLEAESGHGLFYEASTAGKYLLKWMRRYANFLSIFIEMQSFNPTTPTYMLNRYTVAVSVKTYYLVHREKCSRSTTHKGQITAIKTHREGNTRILYFSGVSQSW